MAYIVLVAGAVMALLGALAIITGYPIIQIERGWATVIAGTTLLAGGFMTMALGLVLRAVVDLRTVLNNVALAPPVEPVPATYAESGFGAEPTPTPAKSTPPYGAAALGATAAALPVAALAAAPRHEAEPEAPQAQGVPHAETPVHEAALDEPVETKHEDAAIESPPIDDWLDKAFADLSLSPRAAENDHGPSTQAEPERLHDDHVAARHDGEILYADEHEAASHARHDDETQHVEHAPHVEHEIHVEHDEPSRSEAVNQEPAPSAPPAASDEPAVIGRYEADGTAYTMFADGSIEAQSDAGIYRFASMADLKAFIEG